MLTEATSRNPVASDPMVWESGSKAGFTTWTSLLKTPHREANFEKAENTHTAWGFSYSIAVRAGEMWLSLWGFKHGPLVHLPGQ